ncbi:CIC11C00000004466 [Sungouiella intermedia]|uniref:CIC11C00000004466 n=1 Tax=Sungouiella intermedia TaxID=45354 RepID=A0A1L0D8A8_9ASCO|nr:CIC11C00000004466 [[Candida] intermedia]
MSLEARRALYFKFCVGARFRLTPVPTNSKEVKFLYDSFQKLGTLEYFDVQEAKHTDTNLYGRHVTVLLNASDQRSQLDPLGGVDSDIKTTTVTLRQRQHELSEYLKSICGICRYSYIENDELYFQGRVQVPFKHTLTAGARQYAEQYRMSSSTVNSPFATLETTLRRSDILAGVRHNFQKFHKMEPEFVENGMRAVLRITGEKYSTTVDVDANEYGDVNITDLGKLPAMRNVRGKQVFSGFIDK